MSEAFMQIIKKLPNPESRILAALIEDDDFKLKNVETKTSQQCLYNILQKVSLKLLEVSSEVYSNIFAGFGVEKCKMIVKSSPLGSQISSDQPALTYGEIDFNSYATILQLADIQPCQKFADLGHGIGKSLLATAILCGNKLTHIYGIEIIPELYNISIDCLHKYDQIICNNVNHVFHDSHKNCHITASLGDFLSSEVQRGEYYDWTHADIVFANSTCFDDQLMIRMSQKAEQLKSGSKFITFTYPILSTVFKIRHQYTFAMSWGAATIYIQERI